MFKKYQTKLGKNVWEQIRKTDWVLIRYIMVVKFRYRIFWIVRQQLILFTKHSLGWVWPIKAEVKQLSLDQTHVLNYDPFPPLRSHTRREEHGGWSQQWKQRGAVFPSSCELSKMLIKQTWSRVSSQLGSLPGTESQPEWHTTAELFSQGIRVSSNVSEPAQLSQKSGQLGHRLYHLQTVTEGGIKCHPQLATLSFTRLFHCYISYGAAVLVIRRCDKKKTKFSPFYLCRGNA